MRSNYLHCLGRLIHWITDQSGVFPIARSIKKKVGNQIKIQHNKCAYLSHKEACWVIHCVYINQIYKIQGLANSALVFDTLEK